MDERWGFWLRVAGKAAVLFALCNVVFAIAWPLEALGRLSLYNGILPGRLRLPYGENPAESYNLSPNNVPALLASHALARPKAADEYRVLLLGDSGVWGWLLPNEATLAGRLNALDMRAADGRRVAAYNLGYPILSLTKDLLLLDEAMAYEPDLIVWLVTLDAFYRPQQLDSPPVQHNPARTRALIQAYGLRLDANDSRFVEPDLVGRSIVGQRRALADLLRLQLYGVAWAATGIDQAFPDDITLRQSDFDEELSWHDFSEPAPLTDDVLAVDVLAAGMQRTGDAPVLIINEPIFVSDGRNNHLRYNSFYPRWAYDAYRTWLAAAAEANDWHYLDLWDAVPPSAFSDTPVHLTAGGVEQVAAAVGTAVLAVGNGD